MWTDVLPTTIDPDEAPGGLVMVLYVDGAERLVQRIASHRLEESGFVELSADYAGEIAGVAAGAGGVVSLQVFDGDDGERLLTIPTLDTPRAGWIFYYAPPES